MRRRAVRRTGAHGARFYEWFSERRIPVGPPIWVCGDLHVGNLGPVANARCDVSLEVRDLDQTVLGNPAYDVIRLGFSLPTVALAAGLDGTVIGAAIGAKRSADVLQARTTALLRTWGVA